ncbi:MAG TPA: SDR family NAD(P)-dependent oxidoreductase [Vicinamibacterales bacterium]|nr:SDR family NAD(P)-dependent oxidoreductase [Vicinamibacterales bacterium]
MAKTVLITGAFRGIGRAAAHACAAGGFRVFGTNRSPHADERGIEMLELDVRSDDSVGRCIADVTARAGRIDVLVNNAGIEHVGVAEETTIEDARAVLDTNFFGVVRMTNAVLPQMRARRCGRIITIGSLAAWVGEPGEAFYAASKGALARYTEALRHEVWSLGIHVSLIEPGAFNTNIIPAEPTASGVIGDYDAVRIAAVRTLRNSLVRGGDPGKLGDLVGRVALERRPRFRYGAGAEARWLPIVKVLLPQRLFDYALRRGFGL